MHNNQEQLSLPLKMEAKLNFDFRTNQRLIQKIGLLDGFAGRWEATVQKEGAYAKDLYRNALVQRTAACLRLSGIAVSDDWTARRFKGQLSETPEDSALIGHKAALTFVLEAHGSVPMTEKMLFEIYRLLEKGEHKGNGSKNLYRENSGELAFCLPDGTKRVAFKGEVPAQVPKTLKSALRWYVGALNEKSLHPLLAIGALAYEMACAVPFEEGNVQMFCLVLNLLLLQNGYSFAAYAALDVVLERRAHDLVRSLSAPQAYRGSTKEIIGDWILFFLECLEALSEQLETRYKPYQSAGHYLTDRQKAIKTYLEKNQPLKISDLEKALPDISVHNMRKDLQQLVNLALVEKIGNYKSTIYISKG